MSVSYYNARFDEFRAQSRSAILGDLARHHRHDLEHQQRMAWLAQIDVLQAVLAGCPNGHIHFEFVVPRIGRRADCVLLIGGVLIVLEFKINSDSFDRAGIDQVHDYALDLKNFHRGSHVIAIVPILVATGSTAEAGDILYADDEVASPLKTGVQGLRAAIEKAILSMPGPTIDHDLWASSGYLPTPTIVEAAQALYQNHNVTDIARSDAGARNLQLTDACIGAIIEQSKTLGRKSICFITGVPGAGKTLAGLNIAARRAIDHKDEHAVFLSGNGPLVDVLREALARDQAKREGIRKKDAERRVYTFVQNIHHFRDEYLRDQSEPVEKVVVFDEAQRAWTKEQASKFMQTKRGATGFAQSEPEFLISVMDRHPDWCTVVCLIGGGQEINTGEAGLLEWLTALQTRFPDWDVHASALLDDRHYTVDPAAVAVLQTERVETHPELHLAVSMRSFRAERLSAFVGAILDGNAEEAHALYLGLQDRYPLWVTRDLGEAKAWLRSVARGTERTGLVASSGGHRLRPEGIYVKASIDPANWFLNDKYDVRSSFYLEEVATEFDIQGLELDWVGVCWDADLRREATSWQSYSFRGKVWNAVRADDRQRYLKNAYRVLMTRARQGMVIYIPTGNDDDWTRPTAYYDQTYAFLRDCGVPKFSL